MTSFVVAMNYNRGLGDPSHPRQRIIWTIAPDPRDPRSAKVVLITSREAAQRAGYRLPPALAPVNLAGSGAIMSLSGAALKRSRR